MSSDYLSLVGLLGSNSGTYRDPRLTDVSIVAGCPCATVRTDEPTMSMCYPHGAVSLRGSLSIRIDADRNLDILRALAVLLVLVAHCLPESPPSRRPAIRRAHLLRTHIACLALVA